MKKGRGWSLTNFYSFIFCETSLAHDEKYRFTTVLFQIRHFYDFFCLSVTFQVEKSGEPEICRENKTESDVI